MSSCFDIDNDANEQPAIRYVESDAGQKLTLRFSDSSSGSPVAVDLTQYTAITLRVRRPDKKLITKPAIFDDAPNGLAHFTFAANDLIVGEHFAEVTFTNTSGAPKTYPDDSPFIINVRPQV